jgi:hypothetical protein
MLTNKYQAPKKSRKEVQSRKVIQIPKRNDISLFQKQNCVEGLPVPIFQMIQEYCKEKDYRNLMNTNLSTFQPIKWETVKYSLIGPTKWDKMSPYKINQREERLLNIMNNHVKDKSKQISISFWNVKSPTLSKYSYLFQGIYQLHVTGSESSSSFASVSLDIFKSLRCLCLEKYYGVQLLDVDWLHLVKLSLVECGFSVIQNLNSSQTLKELKIENNYGSLKILCSLDNVDRIEISSPGYSSGSLVFPTKCRNFHINLQCVELKYREVNDAEQSREDNHLFYEKLVICSAYLVFDPRLVDYWKLYSSIEVNCPHMKNGFPSFSVSCSEKISLTGFSLSSWNGSALLNLKELSLSRVVNLDILPEMHCLESVCLEDISSFRMIPGFPRLKKIIVNNCADLERIEFSPQLKELDLRRCPKIKDLSSCAHVKTLNLHQLDSLTSLSEFNGNESSFINSRKEIIVCELRLLRDFSFCQYLYRLELIELRELVSCEGISNIHNLEICHCHALISTKGLRNILGKIRIDECYGLLSLLDLQNIPEVEICYCSEVIDFSGFGHNKSVRLVGDEIVNSFETFQKKNSAIVETIEELTMSN